MKRLSILKKINFSRFSFYKNARYIINGAYTTASPHSQTHKAQKPLANKLLQCFSDHTPVSLIIIIYHDKSDKREGINRRRLLEDSDWVFHCFL